MPYTLYTQFDEVRCNRKRWRAAVQAEPRPLPGVPQDYELLTLAQKEKYWLAWATASVQHLRHLVSADI